MEEKQLLQRTIQERDATIEELRMEMETPDKYIEKVLHGASCTSQMRDEKESLERSYKKQCSEIEQLKDTVMEQLERDGVMIS